MNVTEQRLETKAAYLQQQQLDAANQRVVELQTQLVDSANSYQRNWDFQRRRVEFQRERAEAAERKLATACDVWIEMKAFFDKHGTNLRKDGEQSLYVRIDQALAQIEQPQSTGGKQ